MQIKLYFHIQIPRLSEQYDVWEIHFSPSTVVCHALEQIRTQFNLPEDTEHCQFGLFLMHDDQKIDVHGRGTLEQTCSNKYEKGSWLNDQSTLDYYLLKNEDNIFIKESDSTNISWD